MMIEKINELKKKKNAVILVHNYQRPEIYDVADFIGDSLGLCQEARDTNADIIVFCGVYFMAESAAILNPSKKVIMPVSDAGCAMADMVDVDGLKALQMLKPQAKTVAYVNSNAEVKALADACCTSSNAVNVVKALNCKEIIFVPDRNLAAYVQSKTPDTEIIAWDGYCPMHNAVDVEYLNDAKKNFPNARILVHPESLPEVIKEADYVASTSGMVDLVKSESAEEFLVLTECGMTERLKRAAPEKKFHGLCNMCFDMKKNTLESIYECLVNESPEVKVQPSVARAALRAFNAMFEINQK